MKHAQLSKKRFAITVLESKCSTELHQTIRLQLIGVDQFTILPAKIQSNYKRAQNLRPELLPTARISRSKGSCPNAAFCCTAASRAVASGLRLPPALAPRRFTPLARRPLQIIIEINRGITVPDPTDCCTQIPATEI